MTNLYWDSVVVIDWIQGTNAARIAVLTPIIIAAQNGQLRIVTSYLTMTETVRCNGDTPMSDEEEDRIQAFFRHPFVETRAIDRAIANAARGFCRQTHIERAAATGRSQPPKLQVNDSIHVATALHYGCIALQTFDDGLLRFDDKFGAPRLRIQEPCYVPPAPVTPGVHPEQLDLFQGLDSDDSETQANRPASSIAIPAVPGAGPQAPVSPQDGVAAQGDGDPSEEAQAEKPQVRPSRQIDLS